MHELPYDKDGTCNARELPPTSYLHVLTVSQQNVFNTFGGGFSMKAALINAQNLVENVVLARLCVFMAAFV